MTNIPLSRAVRAEAALGLVPPLIRATLLNEQAFREDYGLETEAKVTFGGGRTFFQRSEFFNKIRSVLAKADKCEVTDVDGRVWTLSNEGAEDWIPKLVLSLNEQRLVLPDFAVFSENATMRIRSLEEAAYAVNLPLDAQEKWRSILVERALENEEVGYFHSDIRDTPVHLERSIRDEMVAGKSSISSLVPNSRRYFERLVGVYDGSASVREYAAGPGRNLFEQLAAWRPYEGFLFSLLLSSHSALTETISVDHLDNEQLTQAYDYIRNHGDILSQLGALEIGLRVLPERPEVEPFLLHLVHQIRDDGLDGNDSEFNLFSALFVLVDGELSRTRMMAEMPPFYRRLASLAQAALIHRHVVRCGVDYEHFSSWAFGNRGEHFYMQSFADMRLEPRWNSDLADAFQFKADSFGRIMIAGKAFEKNIGAGTLHDTILGNEPQSLSTLCEFPRQFFPGPLEGADANPNTLPVDFARVIEEQLDKDKIEASSFVALVNSALIFKITSGHAELATKAIRLGNYTIANLKDKTQLVGILNGLAIVAAVSRNPSLADELRILVRRYSHDSQYGFTVTEAMRTCLMASAAREDLMEWRKFVGEWLTELAFGEFEDNEGERLHSLLKRLLHSVPELWVSCARADAALQAWLFR